MSKVTQYSRISHHTLAGSASATFSVPSSEDFTDGSWSIYDLALSEIGINEDSKKAYIRINDEIKEFEFIGGTAGGESLSDTLLVGNTTNGYDIIVSTDDLIKGGGSSSISLGTTARPNEVKIYTEDVLNTNELTTIPLSSNHIIIDVITGNSTMTENTSNTIQLSATDVASDITDIISVDPQFLGIGTGILSTNTTDNKSSNINVNSYAIDPGVIIYSEDNSGPIEFSRISVTPTSTSIESSFSGNILVDNSSIIMTHQDSGIIDIIRIDPQGLTGGTGIISEDTATGEKIVIGLNPYQLNLLADNVAGSDSSIAIDATSNSINVRNTITGEKSVLNMQQTYTTIFVDSGVDLIDTIAIDPQGLGNGTGIVSIDTATSDKTQTIHTHQDITTTTIDFANNYSSKLYVSPVLHQLELFDTPLTNYNVGLEVKYNEVDLITCDMRAENLAGTSSASVYIEVDLITDKSQVDIFADTIQLSATDVASDITDTISLDPQGLGNGTGILSEDTTNNQSSQLNITPTDQSLNLYDTTFTNYNVGLENAYLSFSNAINSKIVAQNIAGISSAKVEVSVDLTVDKSQIDILADTTNMSLPAYADDATAGTASLTTGTLYQTDGTAASPLNVAGIVMIKQ